MEGEPAPLREACALPGVRRRRRPLNPSNRPRSDGTNALCIRLAVLLAAGLLTSACIDSLPRDAITIVNELDHNVMVVHRFDGVQGEVEGVVEPVLRPGVEARYREPCYDGDLVAISSLTNEEVDRREGPVCQGDDPFVIDGVPG